MSLQDLANLGEFIGGLAVIATLLYLAAQIRQGNRQVEQNTKSLQASTHQAIVGDLNHFRALLIQDMEVARVYRQGLDDPNALSVDDQFRFRALMQSLFSNLQFQFQSRNLGLWAADHQDETIGELASCPGALLWWKQAGYLYDSTFQVYVNEQIARQHVPEVLPAERDRDTS